MIRWLNKIIIRKLSFLLLVTIIFTQSKTMITGAVEEKVKVQGKALNSSDRLVQIVSKFNV